MMIQRIVVTLLLMAICPVVCISQQAGLQVCTDMIEKAAHNIELSTMSYEYLASIYENYCRQDGTVKTEHLDTGLSAVIKAVPVNFTLNAGDSTTAITNFCKTFSSNTQIRSNTFSQNSYVVEKALDATKDCVHIVLAGDRIEHSFMTPDKLVLKVTAGSGHTITLSGIDHSNHVTCKGKGGWLGTTDYSVGTTHTVDANSGTYDIYCTRTAKNEPKDAKLYEQASIALASSAGSYEVYWPQKTVESEREADKIAAEISDLKVQLRKVQSQLSSMATDGDQAQHPFTRGRGNQNYACPPGQFVSAVAVTEWNTDHIDALVANIGVQCRTALKKSETP